MGACASCKAAADVEEADAESMASLAAKKKRKVSDRSVATLEAPPLAEPPPRDHDARHTAAAAALSRSRSQSRTEDR